MPDVFSKEKRSEIMSKIKSSGSKIELAMKSALSEKSIDFEYQPKIFGKPDFFIPPNVVVFCDSSFWHGRNWKELQKELSKGYWVEHIAKNRKRDRVVNSTLKDQGYFVVRCWDTEINKDIEKCIGRIMVAVNAKGT